MEKEMERCSSIAFCATPTAFLINFDVNVELGQDFTNSKKLLKDALEKTKINTGGASCGGIGGIGGGPFPCSSSGPRGTLLYDAVYLSAHDMLYKEVGRKAVILLTDGEDQGSRIKIREAIEIAQKADTICYVILAADRGAIMGFGSSDMHKMTKTPAAASSTSATSPKATRCLRPDRARIAQPIQHRLHAQQLHC